MAKVEVRDHAIWIKHIHGDERLAGKLSQMPAGTLIELIVDGVQGHWRKMDDGKDGRPTNGLRAIGKARDHWHALQIDRGTLVDIDATDCSSPAKVDGAGHNLDREMDMRSKNLGTTAPGYVNRNGQTVVRKTETMGNDHNQFVYVIRCGHCSHEYGANGSDIWQRRCPSCDSGATGLSY